MLSIVMTTLRCWPKGLDHIECFRTHIQILTFYYDFSCIFSIFYFIFSFVCHRQKVCDWNTVNAQLEIPYSNDISLRDRRTRECTVQCSCWFDCCSFESVKFFSSFQISNLCNRWFSFCMGTNFVNLNLNFKNLT